MIMDKCSVVNSGSSQRQVTTIDYQFFQYSYLGLMASVT